MWSVVDCVPGYRGQLPKQTKPDYVCQAVYECISRWPARLINRQDNHRSLVSHKLIKYLRDLSDQTTFTCIWGIE